MNLPAQTNFQQSEKTTLVKEISFTLFENGIFEIVFDFINKCFSDANLHSDTLLGYYQDDDLCLFQFSKDIYNGQDTRNFLNFQRRDKDQVVFIFIPFSFFEDKNKSLEKIQFIYNNKSELINSWEN